VGKVTFDVEKVANFDDCRYYRVLQGDLETFDAILLSIFSLTLQGELNIRYVFIDSIE